MDSKNARGGTQPVETEKKKFLLEGKFDSLGENLSTKREKK